MRQTFTQLTSFSAESRCTVDQLHQKQQSHFNASPHTDNGLLLK